MKPAANVEEFMATLNGDTIDRLFEAVDRTMRELHNCDLCGMTPLPKGHPHCRMCGSPLMIQKCKGCGDWYCKTGCAQSHVCGQGEKVYPFEA